MTPQSGLLRSQQPSWLHHSSRSADSRLSPLQMIGVWDTQHALECSIREPPEIP